MSDWAKFFLIRLPLAAVVIAVVIEGAAALLSGVTLHRHSVDDLANAVMHDQHAYRVALLGDSVTHNVAHKYRIGDAGEVADLTTHAFAGLPSSLFILKRYLESGHRPSVVVIAASHDVYTIPIQKSTFTYYLTSAFTLPYERDFLQRYYGGYVNYAWRPAALSITTKIGEPLFSLLRSPGDQLWTAPEIPAAAPVLESFPGEPYNQKQFQERLDEPNVVGPEVRAILGEMCRLSRQYGFSLHIVWPPVQIKLHQALQANGSLKKIDDQLTAIFKDNQVAVSIDDSDDTHDYPYFDRDLVHIKGEGWEQLYANQLSAYIHQFDGTRTAQSEVADDAARASQPAVVGEAGRIPQPVVGGAARTSPSAAAGDAARIVGRWEGTVGDQHEIMSLDADGTFVCDLRGTGFLANTLSQGVRGRVKGTWTLAGRRMTLTLSGEKKERLENTVASSDIVSLDANALVLRSDRGETSTFRRARAH